MSASKKEKKITVKFFLNHAVEAARGEKGQKLYPLYIQVTYNRKNMQFRSKYGLFYKNLKEVPSELMSFEEKVLTTLIRHEAKESVADYELKGLKRKYEVYSTSVYQTLEEHLKPRLRLAILKTGSELINVLNFYQSQVTVALLYEAATLLFPNFERSIPQKLKDDIDAYTLYRNLYPAPVLSFDFPTLIDWMEGGHKSEVAKLVGVSKKGNPLIGKKVTTLINQAVDERLKSLGDPTE